MNLPSRNIVLIGARGSGKSAVARELSRLTGRSAYSTDEEIVRRSGCSIADFVAAKGWDAFRDLESGVVREISTRDSLIIDTGGGAILRQENVDALRAGGHVFWLRAPGAVLADRIKDDTQRPSLTGSKSFVDEIEDVVAARTPLYTAAAHDIIDVESATPFQSAESIVELFERGIEKT
ncbi:MAG: AAA family ATPase [Candidatus Hydrogenedentes bacterium]|nr:AAA family ATPase [Candidatus Hydrogenedentota bacterium]